MTITMQAEPRRELSVSAIRTVPIFLVLLLMLVLSRWPFLSNTLLGEEGMFAALVIDPIPSSAVTPNGLPQQLVAQVDGRRFYSTFQHPIIPYLIMERGIGAVGRSADVFHGDFNYRTMVARGCYFVLFCLGVSGLLWLAARSIVRDGPVISRLLVPLVVAYLLTTPLALGASIQPQVDGSVGVMLLGTAAFLLVISQGRVLECAGFLLAGLLTGLGKNEWALAFGAAALATLAMQVAWARGRRRSTLVFLVGIAAGVAISLAASTPDYLAGLGVMKRIAAVAKSSYDMSGWKRSFIIPVVLSAIAASALAAWRLRSMLSAAAGTIILVIGGIGLILGFASSDWFGDGFPRYYAPSLVVLGVAVVDRISTIRWTRPAAWCAFVVLACGFWMNGVFVRTSLGGDLSVTSTPGASLVAVREQMAANAKGAARGKAIVLENSSIWIYYPDVSFVSGALGLEGAKELLATQFPNDVDRFVVP